MIELGQLERRHADFARHDARIVVASLEGPDDARQTQVDFPHLVVLADADRKLANTVQVVHPQSSPAGGDTSAPTTVVIDGDGTVRWLYRSPAVIARLSPDEVLRAIAENGP
ncbi:MAG TPA: redoxin domain-containing protein [Pirellulales bacterium]|nr:redoxin domain-containing protein [Pirellulales bacterium]